MAVKIVQHPNGNIIDYGDNLRIERSAMPTRKQRRMTIEDTPAVTVTGEAIYDQVPHTGFTFNVYRLVKNKPHPSIPGKFQQAFHGGPTDETTTWLHVYEAMSAADARDKVQELLGQP
jgi:hypothetical protein